MDHPQQQLDDKILEQYAVALNRKIIASQSDLDVTDRVMPEMIAWCRHNGSIVVLANGTILSCKPNSRLVQNCKIVMREKSLTTGPVYPATLALIQLLLEKAEREFSLREEQSVTAQQQRLRKLVQAAVQVEASDIHIEVRAEVARIRLRRHGELFLWAEWLPRMAREVVAVAFNKETDHAITHFNPLVPQNASMPLEIDGREVRLRLASLPAHGGFDVVLRILATAETHVPTLENLGYRADQIALLKRAIRLPHGAVILAGPTGSGKTTTLASCMQLVDEKRKIYTVEDPVEKLIIQASQVPVNTEHYDRSFASMTRTILRMDPDVIVMGEIRDEDTAAVLIRAAITGHLVFSTIHTNSAVDIITRLIDLGVSSSLLASPNLLACLICQRLVPTLCQVCAKPALNSSLHIAHLPRWRAVFQEKISQLRVRGGDAGFCKTCKGLGIHERTVIAEMIWIDEISRQYIQNRDTHSWTQYLKENNWLTYADRLMALVVRGLCDPLDAEAIIGEINVDWGERSYRYATH